MKPARLPTLPRGYACGRYRVSRRNRIAAGWRSACAAGAAFCNALARLVAGH